MIKKLSILVGLLILSWLCAFEARAGMLVGGEEKIIFSPDKIPKQVTWSDAFSLSETGLATKQLPKDQVLDVWIQTHAFPIGLSWRPPAGANFTASFDGSLNDAGPNFPIEPQLFIRYSCDKVNWSTWYSFTKTDRKTQENQNIYEAKINLPAAASEKYQSLMREWWKTGPIWSSDETEFCEWLVKRDPNFFAVEKPFVGYVQVRIEKWSVGTSQDIKALTVGYFWSASGLSSIPKDKTKVRQNTAEKWFFEAKPKND